MPENGEGSDKKFDWGGSDTLGDQYRAIDKERIRKQQARSQGRIRTRSTRERQTFPQTVGLPENPARKNFEPQKKKIGVLDYINHRQD